MPKSQTYGAIAVSGPNAKRAYKSQAMTSSTSSCLCNTSVSIYGPYTYNYNGCGQGNPFQVYVDSSNTQFCCYQNGIQITCPTCIWECGTPCNPSVIVSTGEDGCQPYPS